MRKFTTALLFSVFCTVTSFASAAEPVRLEQIVSREHPSFNAGPARLVVGRDGMIYLTNQVIGDSFVMRLAPDGTQKIGAKVESAAGNATANKAGVIAASHAHFGRKIVIFDKNFTKIAEVGDFRGGDDVGWDAPGAVEAGESGDFYVLDQHRDRIVRVSPIGNLVRAYDVPRFAEDPKQPAQNFRVSEKNEAFYVTTGRANIRCIGFDGKEKWVAKVGVASNTYEGTSGGYDVGDDGLLYTIEPKADKVIVFNPDGTEAKQFTLDPSGPKPTQPTDRGWRAMRVHGDDLILKRWHPTEMFQRYDRNTGALKKVVTADHERLTVTFDSDRWDAGATIPFKVEFDAGGRKVSPQWRVWARPFGTTNYRQLQLTAGQLQVPKDYAGVYQVKITPEITPLQYDDAPEYRVETAVEVGVPGSKGTVALMTPQNRTHFGRGEEIPFDVLLATDARTAPLEVTVRLMENDRAIAERKLTVAPDAKDAKLILPQALTAALRPADYTLTVAADGLTGVSQPITLGRGVREAAFHTVQYGDYGGVYPDTRDFDAPDLVKSHVERTEKLGFNMTVERLGDPVGSAMHGWFNGAWQQIEPLRKRLASDATAIPVAKTQTAPPFEQVMAGRSAVGTQAMAILMRNDAGLPIEEKLPYDGRTVEQILEHLKKVTEITRPYPAFRGWSWSSNWWVVKRGGDAAPTPEQKAAYNEALKKATETGEWSPILDEISDIRLGHASRAQALFKQTLESLGRGNLVTASAAPFRHVDSYPPVTLANVDETDLQAQWEQIGVPYHAPMNVDFYEPPGKRSWGHPEIWNDDGTGGQILPTLFQMLMRGADGVGTSGIVPNWSRKAGIPDDPRISDSGSASVFRALNELLLQYGPWITTLKSNDQVAIIADGRMFRIDKWDHVTGHHFARVFEAYIACLHAHHPASIVFTEDASADRLKQFKAILLVNQRVQWEPQLLDGLKAAQSAGVSIFADGTCREELVKDFKPLGITFDQLERDPNPAGDDNAYWRFRDYGARSAPKLAEVLNAVAKQPASIDEDEVFVTERVSEEGRFVFVVNNTVPDLSPGHLWRMTLAVTSRVPLVTDVMLPDLQGKAVYDVFAGQGAVTMNDTVKVELRDLPARLLAILPAPIGNVELAGPKTAQAGQAIQWTAKVLDAKGQAIRTSLPIRVRMLNAERDALDELCTSAPSTGVSGEMIVPLNPEGNSITLELTDLITGKTATLSVPLQPAKLPVAEMLDPAAKPTPRAQLAIADAKSSQLTDTLVAADQTFGPHVREITILSDGRTAVMNTMNWDHNLYAIDVETGKTLWRQRVGDYFAFSPTPASDGVAVQGFDFRSAEGYSLYLLGRDGKPDRRFALYGLPKRLPHRFVPALIGDRINNFAAAPDGSWVASAGDLGLAVWARDGKLLWSQDWWKTVRKDAVRLAAIDNDTLLLTDGMKAAAYSAASGTEPKWQLNLAPTGDVRKIKHTPDGKTIALLTTYEGGRVFVLSRDAGKVITSFPTAADDLAISPDGSAFAIVIGNLLKLYTASEGLRWTLSCDDRLHHPTISPDGELVAVGSELGTLMVANVADGGIFAWRDLKAQPAPAWLPGGDLIVGTWMGTVLRCDKHFNAEKWRTLLRPEATDMRGKILADQSSIPLTRIAAWSDAKTDPVDLSKNLLTKTRAYIKFVPSGGWGGIAEFQLDPKLLYDGSDAPPPDTWLHWNKVGFFAETSPTNYVLIDTFHDRVRLDAITLVEDPSHPESWLRDATLDYWDSNAQQWKTAKILLSDAPIHTHTFETPVQASRFRIMMPRGVVGNLRLAEIMFHGQVVGPAHPDAAAKKAVAVLYDENFADFKDHMGMQVGGHYQNVSPDKLGDAFSGGHALSLPPDAMTVAAYVQPFGHEIPGWNVPIAQDPKPGEYRYLQFALKATGPDTKGAAIRLTGVTAEGGRSTVEVRAGARPRPNEQVNNEKQVAETVPNQWTVQRVDLAEMFGAPVRIIGMNLLTGTGGGAAFDRILLGRSEQDLAAAVP